MGRQQITQQQHWMIEETDEERQRTLLVTPSLLKCYRKRLGLSQMLMAKLVGVATLTLNNWETGKARPQKRIRPALITLLNQAESELRDKLEELGYEKKGKKYVLRAPLFLHHSTEDGCDVFKIGKNKRSRKHFKQYVNTMLKPLWE